MHSVKLHSNIFYLTTDLSFVTIENTKKVDSIDL